MTMTTVREGQLTVLKGNKAAEKCLQHVHLNQTTEAILHPESRATIQAQLAAARLSYLHAEQARHHDAHDAQDAEEEEPVDRSSVLLAILLRVEKQYVRALTLRAGNERVCSSGRAGVTAVPQC